MYTLPPGEFTEAQEHVRRPPLRPGRATPSPTSACPAVQRRTSRTSGSARPSRWRSTARRSSTPCFNGRFTPRRVLVSPNFEGYRPGACEYCKKDADEAKELLAEAGGWKGGKLSSGPTPVPATTPGCRPLVTRSRPPRHPLRAEGQPAVRRVPRDRGQPRLHRSVPPRLGPGLPGPRDLPRPAVRHAAAAATTAATPTPSSTPLIDSGQRGRRRRRPSRRTSRPRTSSWRTCRSSRCGSAS